MTENSIGYLLVSARTADGVLLVPGALVRVYDSEGGLLFEGTTNRDGYTKEIEVVTPPKANSLTFGQANPYAIVSVFVEKEGFYEARYPAVQVFSNVVTIQQTNLQPSLQGVNMTAAALRYGVQYE